MGAQAGLTFFFEKWSIFPQGTAKSPLRAHKPRIVSGLIKAHTRWPKKYPSIFYQILSPPFGCNEPIMSPSKIYLRFSYIEKTFKKALQKLVDFCMVFWKFLTKLLIFPVGMRSHKKPCVFFWEPRQYTNIVLYRKSRLRYSRERVSSVFEDSPVYRRRRRRERAL